MATPRTQNNFNELWAGRIFGTNTGKVFLRVGGEPRELSGALFLADDDHGNARLDVTGSFEEGVLRLKAVPAASEEGVQLGNVEAVARLQPNGQLLGQWESDVNTGGTFHLYPHTTAMDETSSVGPEQLYTVSRELGALQLYRDDIIELIRLLERDLRPSRVIVSHLDRGAEISRFASDFEAGIHQHDRLEWIKLTVQAAHASGINRVATVDLGQAFNRVTTQGSDESWVLGEAEALASHLRKREKRLSTKLGKYRVSLNQLIAVLALIAMPDLEIVPRGVFVLTVLALLIGAEKLQRSLIPNLSVQLSAPRPSLLAQSWPSVVSWLISMTAGVAASIVYGLLQ
jgi:hypothetical protein